MGDNLALDFDLFCILSSLNDRFSSWLLDATFTLVIAQDFCRPGQRASCECPEGD